MTGLKIVLLTFSIKAINMAQWLWDVSFSLVDIWQYRIWSRIITFKRHLDYLKGQYEEIRENREDFDSFEEVK